MGREVKKDNAKSEKKKQAKQQKVAKPVQISSEDEEDQFEVLNESRLLKNIEEEILHADEPEKLSWGALYQLKQQHLNLDQELDKDLQALRKKYQKLKEPIFLQMSQVVSAEPVDKNLYTAHQLTKNLSLKKTKPSGIQKFWSTVFTKSDLLSSQQDQNIFGHCISVVCSTQGSTDTVSSYKATLKFQKNEFMNNGVLEIKMTKQDEKLTREIPQKLSLKNPVEDISQCLICNLFDEETELETAFDAVSELFQAYHESLNIYFMEQVEAQDGLDDSDDDEDEEEDSEEEDDGKSKKKVKGESLEKPECKQQ